MAHEDYVKELKEKIDAAYDVAAKARDLGKDPDVIVESLPAGDLATRVEGLVGPKGIAARIKEVGRENIPQITKEILGEDIASLSKEGKEGRIDQAVRTGLAIITEGVVAAPIEGISKVAIKSNPDGSQYLSIYFSGPIRSAGGTAQGLAVLIGDYIRKEIGLQEYRPTQDEIERYLEEIKIYHTRVTRLQYMPPEEDIRTIISNLPICVEGDPTEEREVAVHRDLARVDTNRIRGGMCLVIGEGIAQKAKKLIKLSKDYGVDWGWITSTAMLKGKKKEIVVEEKDADEKHLRGVMAEIVGGRPIFAAPGMDGGFRLRYGRSRTAGIASKSFSPATMILLDEFIANGTQLKLEKPGKGCVATPCDTIEGPVVKLRDGSVRRVSSSEEAHKMAQEVEEIIYVGDMLVSYGDFLQTNTVLMPAGYCEEWWLAETPGANIRQTPEEAVAFAIKNDAFLHPLYTYHWEDAKAGELAELAAWLATGRIEEDHLMLASQNPRAKRTLEILCVPHDVKEGRVEIGEYVPLLAQLGIYDTQTKTFNTEKIKTCAQDPNASGLELIKKVSSVRIRPKVGTYLGARMGRPEKAKERKMEPPVHSLFPIGMRGGKDRSINNAAESETVPVDLARYDCPKCGLVTAYPRCPGCGGETLMKRMCPACNIRTEKAECPKCKKETRYYETRDIPLKAMWKKAIEDLGSAVVNVKGVQGMISEYKIPEPLEKGILRAKNKVYVFKDGTIRFDATDVPLTHFRPREVGVGVEKLRSLGYEKDCYGKELESVDQILELMVQDVVIPYNGGDYLARTSWFIDELLQRFYGLPAFYNAKNRDDLIGHLLLGLAPHTSAAITGRIIGFTHANACLAHPYWHAAKRRNCDGDEDAVMLLMDTLLNFSKKYLPAKRGGQMDAPLVFSTILNALEIDDEAHKMDIGDCFPTEFYEATWQGKNPSEVKVATVADILQTNPYSGIMFTHDTSDMTGPVLQTRYVQIEDMKEKVDAQLRVAEKVRAVDEREVAELIINSHFLRDTYGNLRAFSKQKFRCVKCNESYRRVPLIGKCTKCGGKLLLTVSEGTIKKYLDISIGIADKYQASEYMKQRLQLLKKELDSLFKNDLSKQISISDYM